MAEIANDGRNATSWLSWLSATKWLSSYRSAWLSGDLAAGVTLAAYAIPVSLAYATLAGLPPQVGVYGYLLGGLGYALFGSSRQLAIGPTSAISLMVAGTVGAMANGDAERYFEIASLAAFTVAGLCLLAWLFRLSALVKLISDSILVGFQNWRRSDHRNDSVTEFVRRGRRRSQFFRANCCPGRTTQPDAVSGCRDWDYCHHPARDG